MSTSALALVALLLKEGYELVEQPLLEGLIVAFVSLAVALSVLSDVVALMVSREKPREFRRILPQTCLLLLMVVFASNGALWGLFAFMRQGWVLLRAAVQTERYQRYMESLQARPAQIFVLSFVLVIAVGALLLSFPRATTDGEGARALDAVFTSTSATCVTGLTTLNTVSDRHEDVSRQTFTPFGQFVVLVLIQMGGLGIMTLSAATLMLTGKRLDMRSRALMQSILEEDSAKDLKRTLRDIFLMTFVIEAVGACLLALRFWQLDYDVGRACWLGVFHSVSAFCNAGFSLFGDSLMSFQGDWFINLVHAALIILGGLGFAVVIALAASRTWSNGLGVGWRRLALQIRMVLWVTFGLIVAGTILTFYLEFDHSLRGLSVSEKLLASFFQSVSFRTAGFNTVDMGQMGRAMVVVACVWMFIGASPGSTGGGIKTSTAAVLMMSIRASLTGRSDVEIGKHTVGPQVVTRAISVLAVAFVFLLVGLVLLLLTQGHLAFEALLFEAVSALGTAGLSMGITPDLTSAGKMIIICLMFVGRLGPLTVALAVGERQASKGFSYPEERIVVG